MRRDLREGLTLTRCDVCGRRQFCAVAGTAMCERCCPGAVEAARGVAFTRRMNRKVLRDEDVECVLPPEGGGDPVGSPVPWREVAPLFANWERL